MKKLLPAFIALFGITLTASAGVANGSKAPDFTLPAADGSEVSLSDFAGKYVVLEWVNPGCPFVQKFYNVGAMQKYQEKAQTMEELDVVWLSINSTNQEHSNYLDPAESRAYYEEKDVHSTWLLDEDGTVGKAYDATNTPHMFIISPEGAVLYQGAIDSIRSANADDIAKADNYVMAALESLAAGEPIETDRTRPYGCSVKY
jgi:peroxiredoxin